MSQSLDRGLRILDEIAAGRRTLTEMSESLGVHKSTVIRLLATLQQHHFVHREDQLHYQLGRRLFDLASFALESREVVALARSSMRQLMQSTGHAVYLATLEAGEVAVVEIAASRGPLHKVLRVGEGLPVHATASGKILLAGLGSEEVDEVLESASLRSFTGRTVVDRAAIRAQIESARSSGYALELAEHEEFVNAVAAPVRDFRGAVVAAMTLTLPAVALDARGMTGYVPQLLAACGEVSAELGWG